MIGGSRGGQTRMRVLHVVAETPLSFLQHLKDITYIERRPLRYVVLMARHPCSERIADQQCAPVSARSACSR